MLSPRPACRARQGGVWPALGFASLRASAAAGLLLPTLVGCSTGSLPPGAVLLLEGQETDTWSASPPPTQVVVDLLQGDQRSTIAQAAAPASTIEIGSGGPSGSIGTFEVQGLDADRNRAVYGVTVPFNLLGFDAIRVPIFVARAGGFSRPPSGFSQAHAHALWGVVSHAFLFVVGGDDARSQLAQPEFYDVSTWTGYPPQDSFPITPKSMVTVGTTVLLLNDSQALWIDLGSGTTSSIDAPAGLAFSDVAGGDTFGSPDGSQFIVGATRTSGEPTNKVLRVDADTSVHALTLSTPRLGAAAGMVSGQLLVAGGSADGAGAELLDSDGAAFSDLPFPPDATQGAGLAELDSRTVLLAGGHASDTGMPSATRTLDLSCTADCETATLDLDELDLQRTRIFSVSSDEALILGESPDGENLAYTLSTGDSPTLTARALRAPRVGASPVLLPNGQAALVGGSDRSGAAVLSLEVFVP